MTTRPRHLGPTSASLVGVIVAAGLLGGCGGSSGSSSPPPSDHTTPHQTPHRTPPSTGSGGSTSAADKAAITSAFVTFFSGETPGSKKITLVENGPAFSAVIDAQAGSGLSKSTTASVSKVTVTSPTQATVVYTVSLGGVPALKNQPGSAVKDGGQWKVSASTFCALLTLEGSAPAFCKTLP